MDYPELIQTMRKREMGALDRFQTAFTPLLRYIITPILSDERDREECLSDVALQVWDNVDGYDPSKASFTTWLSALARNTALNRRRSIERRRESEPPDEDIPASVDSPEQTVLKEEAARAVWDAVGRLDRRDRDLFLRKYYYYQPTAQIAAELGLSLRAVEGRLYRVRKRLQDELGGVYRG